MIPADTDFQTEVLKKLREYEGLHWREVHGEIQDDYDEFPLFILLYEDSDVRESHAALFAVIEPYMAPMGPIQFTVSYTVLTDVLDITVDTLMDNDEIRAPGPSRPLPRI